VATALVAAVTARGAVDSAWEVVATAARSAASTAVAVMVVAPELEVGAMEMVEVAMA